MKSLLSPSSSESLASSDSLFRPYSPSGSDEISQCTCEANPFCTTFAQQDQTQGKNTDLNTAANRFFRNRDLCTMLSRILIAYPTSTKMCMGDTNIGSLLVLRGVTPEAWQAVMSEHPTRCALNLTSRDEATQGILTYLKRPSAEVQTSWDMFYPFVSHSPADVAALRADEIENPSQYATWPRRDGPGARIITHHPAVVHEHNYSPNLNCSLFISAENYNIYSKLPLLCDMFLTQPPQKSVRFGIRYEYAPGSRTYLQIDTEQGVRFGDLVAHFEREPELLAKPTPPRAQDRGWRSDEYINKYIYMVRVTWEYKRVIPRGHRYEMNARLNSYKRERGKTDFLHESACRQGCKTRHF